VGAGRVAERLEGVEDDLLGERLGCVVGAGVASRRCLLDHEATVVHDEGVASKVGADRSEPGGDVFDEVGVVADHLGEGADRGWFGGGAEGLGERGCRWRLRRGLVVFDPRKDRRGKRLVIGVGRVEVVEGGERDLWFGTGGADEPDEGLVDGDAREAK